MDFVAHTPPKNDPDRPPHLYAEHIREVVIYGMALFESVLTFCSFPDEFKRALADTLKQSLLLHDLGKLDDENQAVLQGVKTGQLNVDHIEAGVAVAEVLENELMAWIIRGHHAPGLPNKKTERQFSKGLKREFGYSSSATALRGWRHKRNPYALNKKDFENHLHRIQHTNENLDAYQSRQKLTCGEYPETSQNLPDQALLVRIMLSCLVQADHLSTACYSENKPMPEFSLPQTKWNQRLVKLNSYIEGIAQKADNSVRNQLRSEFYHRCYVGELLDNNVVSCSASVGLGKTTSVMAYLFRRASQANSPRIFVVAPFSNIIDQTVKTLRKSVVLENEDPEKMVVAHHHKANFSDQDMRQYAVNWQAPIVVTTAVQFFETLAAARPSDLKKLHAIIGASIFIDESHACLPPELLKTAWHWLNQLSKDYGCNIVLSSGSMVRFWNDDYLVDEVDKQAIPDLMSDEFTLRVQQQETQRVEFQKAQEEAFSLGELIQRLKNEKKNWKDIKKPSCLVIVNTVQSAAVIAKKLAESLDSEANNLQEKQVLHLSTALAPIDREIMLNEVLRRQQDSEWDNKGWFLIATSTVEAGVDLDFQVGYREKSSVTSLLQVSGRINRHDQRNNISKLYLFTLQPSDRLSIHPGFKEASSVLDSLWSQLIDSTDLSQLCTMAIRKELSRFPSKEEKSDKLIKKELALNFQNVAEEFRIIDSDTCTVITSADLVEKLKLGISLPWQEIQKNSVQLWGNKIRKLKLNAIGNQKDEVYSWTDTYEYDPEFLGIMSGLLKADEFLNEQGGVF